MKVSHINSHQQANESRMLPIKEFSDEQEKPAASWLVTPTTLRIGEISPKFSRPVQSTQSSTTKIWRLPSHRNDFGNSKKIEEKLPAIGTTQLMKTSLPVGGNSQNNSPVAQTSGKNDCLTTEKTFTCFEHQKEYPSALHSMKELLKMIDAVHQKKLKASVENFQEKSDDGDKKPQMKLLIGRKHRSDQSSEEKDSTETLGRKTKIAEVISFSHESTSGNLSKVAKKKERKKNGEKVKSVNRKLSADFIRETRNVSVENETPSGESSQNVANKTNSVEELNAALIYSVKPVHENLESPRKRRQENETLGNAANLDELTKNLEKEAKPKWLNPEKEENGSNVEREKKNESVNSSKSKSAAEKQGTIAFEARRNTQSTGLPVFYPGGDSRKSSSILEVFNTKVVSKQDLLISDERKKLNNSVFHGPFSELLENNSGSSKLGKGELSSTRGSENVSCDFGNKSQRNKPVTIVSASQSRSTYNITKAESKKINPISDKIEAQPIRINSTKLEKPAVSDLKEKMNQKRKVQSDLDEQIEKILRLQSPFESPEVSNSKKCQNPSLTPKERKAQKPEENHGKKENIVKKQPSPENEVMGVKIESLDIQKVDAKDSGSSKKPVLKLDSSEQIPKPSNDKQNRGDVNESSRREKAPNDFSWKTSEVNETKTRQAAKHNFKPDETNLTQSRIEKLKSENQHDSDTDILQTISSTTKKLAEKIDLNKTLTENEITGPADNFDSDVKNKNSVSHMKSEPRVFVASSGLGIARGHLENSSKERRERFSNEFSVEKVREKKSRTTSYSKAVPLLQKTIEENTSQQKIQLTWTENQDDAREESFEKAIKLNDNDSKDNDSIESISIDIKPKNQKTPSEKISTDPTKKDPKKEICNTAKPDNASRFSDLEKPTELKEEKTDLSESRLNQETKAVPSLEETAEKSEKQTGRTILKSATCDPGQKQKEILQDSEENGESESSESTTLVSSSPCEPTPAFEKAINQETLGKSFPDKETNRSIENEEKHLDSAELRNRKASKLSAKTHSQSERSKSISPSRHSASKLSTGSNFTVPGDSNHRKVSKSKNETSYTKDQSQKDESTVELREQKTKNEKVPVFPVEPKEFKPKLPANEANKNSNDQKNMEKGKTDEKEKRQGDESIENLEKTRNGRDRKERFSATTKGDSTVMKSEFRNRRTASAKRDRSLSPTFLRSEKKDSVKVANIRRSTSEKSLSNDEAVSNQSSRYRVGSSSQGVSENQKHLKSENDASRSLGKSETTVSDVPGPTGARKKSIFDIIGSLWSSSEKPKNTFNSIAEEDEKPDGNEKPKLEVHKRWAKPPQEDNVSILSTKQSRDDKNEKLEKKRKMTSGSLNSRTVSPEKQPKDPPLTSSKGKPLWAPSSNQREQNVLLKKSMGLDLTPKEKMEPAKGKPTLPIKPANSDAANKDANVSKPPKPKPKPESETEQTPLHPNMMKLEVKCEKKEKSLWEKLKISLFGEFENDSGDENDIVLEDPPSKPKSNQLKSKLNVLHIVQPLNMKEEKEKFFEADFKYDPQFTYSEKLTREVVQKYNIASSKYLEIVSID